MKICYVFEKGNKNRGSLGCVFDLYNRMTGIQSGHTA
jgi:hypothetical protein